MVYYNEIDAGAALWLQELMTAGAIPTGHVDNRPIQDVTPEDLNGYTQCHFFAGIGVWAYALRLADWPEDRPVWTGSCPCQPFSASGRKKGFEDDRHLWPYFSALISQCRPPVVFGEQVAAALGWWDLVSGELEDEGYACGATIIGAHSVGAPHIRQRLYWVADANGEGSQRRRCTELSERAGELAIGAGGSSSRMADSTDQRRVGRRAGQTGDGPNEPERSCDVGGVGDTRQAVRNTRSNGHAGVPSTERCLSAENDQRSSSAGNCGVSSVVNTAGEQVGLSRRARVAGSTRSRDTADTPSDRCGEERPNTSGITQGDSPQRLSTGSESGILSGGRLAHADGGQSSNGDVQRRGRYLQFSQNPTAGSWSPADWIYCRDGKYRPVEPGTFPLAHRAPARVGRLRGYGNAIVAETAAAFIRAYQEIE